MGWRWLHVAVAATLVGGLPCAALAQQQSTFQVNPDSDQYVTQNFASDPKGAIRRARELIAAGKMDLAIKRLEEYVQIHPWELDPHRFLGDLYFRSGRLDRAIFVYRSILVLVPQDKETHNRLGTVYAVQNRVDDAIAQFNAALPGTDSVADLVSLHERKGDLPAYREQVQREASEFPTDPAIQGELGQIYEALHEPVRAQRYFQRALDSDPKDLTSLNGLGLVYLAMNQYADSIRAFQACLNVQPQTYECEDNLGAAQLQAGQLSEAKKTLDVAYRLAPERAETLVNYGYLADAHGDWQRAVAYYAQAIAKWPYLREAYIDLGLAYEDHHLFPLAQAALLKGIASVVDDGRMHYLLGQAYAAEGKRDDALAQFKLAAKGADPVAARIAQARFSEMSSAKPER